MMMMMMMQFHGALLALQAASCVPLTPFALSPQPAAARVSKLTLFCVELHKVYFLFELAALPLDGTFELTFGVRVSALLYILVFSAI